MKLLLVPVLIGAVGCLPPYDNKTGPITMPDGGGGDGPPAGDMGEPGSGHFAEGQIISVEKEVRAEGPVVHLYRYTQPAFTSMPADVQGNFKFEIPQSVFDSGKPHYPIIEGTSMTSMGKAILPTWIAPPQLWDDTNPHRTKLTMHLFENQDDMKGVQGTVASELAAQGAIPSAADFKDGYTLIMGPLAVFDELGISPYKGGVIEVTDNGKVLDNTNCKPTMQCCVYWTTGTYGDFAFGNTKNFIHFGTNTGVGTGFTYPRFLIICPVAGATPGELAGEVTLTQKTPPNMLYRNTGTLADDFPGRTFDPIVVPKVRGAGVMVEWWIYP